MTKHRSIVESVNMSPITVFICSSSFILILASADNKFAGPDLSHLYKIGESVNAEVHRVLRKRSISESDGESLSPTNNFRSMFYGDMNLKHLVKREVYGYDGESEEQNIQQRSTPSNEEQDFYEVEGDNVTEINDIGIITERCQPSDMIDCMISLLNAFYGDTIPEERCPIAYLANECATELTDKCLEGVQKSQARIYLEKFQNTIDGECPVNTGENRTTVVATGSDFSTELSKEEAMACISEIDLPSMAERCERVVMSSVKDLLDRIRTDDDAFCLGFVGGARCAEEEIVERCSNGAVKYFRKATKERLDAYPKQHDSEICTEYFSEYE